MRKYLPFIAVMVFIFFSACGFFRDEPSPFISTWDLSNTSDNVLTLPLDADGTYDFTIDWGDGTTEAITGPNAHHGYASSGPFTVVIEGTCNGFGFYNQFDDNSASLTGISQWGKMKLHNKGRQFINCSSLTSFPETGAPDLRGITNMTSMFENASAFNQDMSTWDTSQVADMSYMFFAASAFNQDISIWDVSQVTNMAAMFVDAWAFNQDLSSWNISRVTNLAYMFYSASAFNQDISAWDTSQVTDMKEMFAGASSFTNGGNPTGLNNWVVQATCEMTNMFSLCPLSPMPDWY